MKGYHYSEETRKKMSDSHIGEKNYGFGKKMSEESRKNMSIAQKLRKLNKGENHPLATSNIETITAIKIAIRNEIRNKDIENLFGKNKTYISNIKNNNVWRDVIIPMEGSSEENEIIQKYNIPLKKITIKEESTENIIKKVKVLSGEHKMKLSEAGKNRKYSDESKLKMSQSSLKMSDETKKKISESRLKNSNKDKKDKQITFIKISEAMKGRDTKFDNIQVEEIREKYATGNYGYRQLAREYNCDHTLISRMINFKGAYKKIS